MTTPWCLNISFWLNTPKTAQIAVKVIGIDQNQPHFRGQVALTLNKNVVSANISAPQAKPAFLSATDLVRSVAFIQKTNRFSKGVVK